MITRSLQIVIHCLIHVDTQKKTQEEEKDVINLPKVQECKTETMHTREQEEKEEIIYTGEGKDQTHCEKKRTSRKGRTN